MNNNQPNNANIGEIKSLENRLCVLAGLWRSAKLEDMHQEAVAIVQEYHEVMTNLFAVGWQLGVEPECELPAELMPAEYLQRFSRVPRSWKRVIPNPNMIKRNVSLTERIANWIKTLGRTSS